MRVGVLGGLEVKVDGVPVTVPPGRRRVALACLTVHLGRPVPVDVLVDAVWGEQLPHDPPAALHTVISRLRTVLGDVIRHDERLGYRLDLPPECLDSGRLEVLLGRAEHADPAEARELLAQALGLWRGPAYADVADTPFITVAAMRLEGLRVGATEHLAALSADAGDTAAAISLTQELLAREPFREGAVEVLVTALYREGRQADALAECRRYRERLAEELGLDPVPSLARLEEQVLGHDVPGGAEPSAPPVWLDTSSAFIGREDELADLVAAALANRLTVVTGPGGVGKSRLAAQALPLLHARSGMPSAVTELASTTDGGAALAVATSLGLRPPTPAVATDLLLEHLRSSPHLLVIDNCEHLLGEVSALVGRLTTRCPGVRVLATSRRRLGIGSERVVPLAPLEVPAADDEPGLRMAAAVRLVTDRVRRVSPGFAVTADNAAAVGELCRRLDGLPLALELAASRVATRGVAEVLAPLVEESPGDGLEPVVAWSYRLLTPAQQTLLVDLSVFGGEFTTEELRGVVAHLPQDRSDIGADLAELVESSLVSARVDGAGVRHRVLALVRAFATERMRAEGRTDEVGRAHATWVAELTERIARDWPDHDGAQIDARLRRVVEEVETALWWSLRAGGLDLAARIATAVGSCLHWTPPVQVSSLFLEVAELGAAAPVPQLAGGVGVGAFVAADRGDLEDADRLAWASLRMAGDGGEPLTPLLALAVAAMYRGDREGAERWFQRLAQRPELVADATASLALNACYHEDLPTARERIGTALAAGASAPDASLAFARFAAGEIAVKQDLEVGAMHLRRAAEDGDRVGAEQVSRVARVALLATLTRAGRHGEAIDLAPRLLTELRAKGAWVQLWTTLRMSAELLAGCDRAPEAAFVLEASLVAPSAPPLVGHDVDLYADVATDLSARLGPAAVAGIRRLAAATPRGQVVRRAEVALLALRDEGSRAARP